MCKYYSFIDYENIVYDDVEGIAAKTTYLCEDSEFAHFIEEPEYLDTLDTYLRKINRVSATLLILQIL